MKKLITLTKTLLVLAGLCVGVNAWADWTTVYSNDYTNASTYATGWTNSNTGRIGWGQWTRQDLDESISDKTAMRIYQNCSNNGSDAYFTGLSSVAAYTSSKHYKIEFDFGLTTNNSQAPSFYVYALDNTTPLITFQGVVGNAAKCTYTTKAGNTGSFYSSQYTYNSYKLTDGSPSVFNHVVIEADEENGTRVTVSSSETDEETTIIDAENMLYVGKMQYKSARYMGAFAIDNLNVSIYSETEIVPNPSAEITGVNGNDRTVTMTLGTGSSSGTVIKYYTDTESQSDLTTYSGPFVVSETATFYYYAESTSGATSEVQSIEVNCGEITLNSPVISVTDLVLNGSYYNAIFNATYNPAGVEFTPTATLSATFTPEGGSTIDVVLPYTATAKGTLTVTATAEGFTSAQTTVNVAMAYAQTWQSADFSALTDEDVASTLGENWTLQSGTGRWASWKDQTYTYYSDGSTGNITTNERLRMRGVIVLNLGYGLGRNTTGNENISVLSTNEGDVTIFQMYNGFGNSEVADASYYVYALNTGSAPSVGTKNSALLVQATVYSPVTNIPATIGAAGYATFSNPDFALDFTNTDVKAYTASLNSDNTVLLTPVTQVPANTGLVLAGAQGTYDIPVITEAAAITGNLLKPSADEEITASTDKLHHYVLAKRNDNVGFYKLTEPKNIGAGKAYLETTVPLATNADSRVAWIFADGTTGIKTTNLTNDTNETIYNLNGQRVAAPQKGLYIVNGKKVIMK